MLCVCVCVCSMYAQTFGDLPQFSLVKELFVQVCPNQMLCFENHSHNYYSSFLVFQIFSTPHCHPKSKPFLDHMLNFTLLDDRIWFRNYQVFFHQFSQNSKFFVSPTPDCTCLTSSPVSCLTGCRWGCVPYGDR